MKLNLSALSRPRTLLRAMFSPVHGLPTSDIESVPSDSGANSPANLQATVPAPSAIDINQLLHDGRSAFLRQMPKIKGTLLSAGCSGTWYFDWIAERTGHQARHIGLEFYSPKPDDLPPGVEWIANTVGDMSGVKDGECELVFSGQNLEHLWPEDVAGFFLESHRVLSKDGWIVVDSPNRLVTEGLVWSHPEHTVEYTPAEARHIMELAGFDVIAVKGIWLCRDPKTERLFAFDPNVTEPEWTVTERCLCAAGDPDRSFIWWIEAQKSTRAPDVDGVRSYAQQIYRDAWPERTRRYISQIGSRVDASGTAFAVAEVGESGALFYGPYMPLKAGTYAASFKLKAELPSLPEIVTEPTSVKRGDGQSASDASAHVVRCDVLGLGGREIIVRYLTVDEIATAGGVVTLPFALSELEFGIQARCIALGNAKITCAQPVIA